MSQSKKHHFVAQSVLERFKSNDNMLWHYSAHENGEVEHRNPRSIFHIWHDNTYIDGPSKHAKLETAYSKFDGKWLDLTNEMIAIVGAGKLPSFEGKNRKILFGFLHRQKFRSPDRFHDRDQTPAIERGIANYQEKNGPVSQSVLDDDTVLHNAKVLARGKAVDPMVIACYEKFEVAFLKTSLLIEPFIIGSAISCSSNGLTIYPISRCVALALRPLTANGSEIININQKNRHIVQDANKNMAKRSRWGIAGCDKAQIERLARLCPQSASALSS